MCPVFSLIVAAHNRAEYLRVCLHALQRIDFAPDAFEVIVVNDGSTDQTKSLLDQQKPQYRFTAIHTENRGLAGARNLGIEHASGELLMMLDNDCLVSPDSLRHLLAAHQANPGEMLISSIRHINVRHVPRLIEKTEHCEELFPVEKEFLLQPGEESDLQVLLRRIKQRLPDLSTGWMGAQGPTVCMQATQFRSLGGFDADIKTYGMEDFDLAFRAVRAGLRLVHVPQSIMYHMDHGHAQAPLFHATTKSAQYFYRKHGQQPEAKPFLKFLLGHTTYVEFNNIVAEARGEAPVHDPELDRHFSIYGMVRQRDRQWQQQPKEQASKLVAGAAFFQRFLFNWIQKQIDDDPAVKLEVLDQLAVEKAAVIAPHPDDEVIGCGGMISRLVASGAQVDVIFVTSGSGAPPRTSEETIKELSEQRRVESLRATRMLGVHRAIHLDLPERKVARHFEHNDLDRVLACERYDAIFTVGPNEFHPDHCAVWQWVAKALKSLSYKPQLFLYEVWGSCRPNCLISLSEQEWKAKIQALDAYRTQMQQIDYRQFADLLASARGRLAPNPTAATKAEAFQRVHDELL